MLSYFKLPKLEKRLFREALWLIYAYKFRLMFSSFKKCSDKLKSTGEEKNCSKKELTSLRIAITRANRLSFWKNKCLVNTLAARKMLNKRNIYSEAFLGLRKDKVDDSLNAHAWIISNEFYLVPIEMEYTKVYQF